MGKDRNPDISPHSYSHLILDKGAKIKHCRNNSLLNKWCWEHWISICRKLKPGPCLSPCTKINSKWERKCCSFSLHSNPWNIIYLTF
jgi:hypothetical protein